MGNPWTSGSSSPELSTSLPKNVALKVSMDVMKPWIAKRITEMLGFEDDIVVEPGCPDGGAVFHGHLK